MIRRFSGISPFSSIASLFWFGAALGCSVGCNAERSERARELSIGEPAPELDSSIPVDEKAAVVELGREVLEAYFRDGRDAALQATVAPAPETFEQVGPTLYVTLRNEGILRASYSKTGKTFAETIRLGVVRAIEDERFGGVLEEDELSTIRLEFNAVFAQQPLGERELDDLSDRIEPGRHAFQFNHDDGRAFFKETVMITHNYGHEEAFERLCLKADLADDCYTDPDLGIDRYKGEHWIEEPSEPGGYFELFRGHRVIRPDDVSRAALEEAAQLGSEYLRAHQLDSGAFEYLYEPHADTLIDDDNTVRQAGAVYSASKLATYFGDAESVQVARNAIDNILSYEETNDEGSYLRWGRTSLGLTGLALLGLVELEHSSVGDEYEEAALRLARGIVGQQNEDGRLRGDFVSDSDPDSSQQFYPGEALLALSRAASLWPEEDWILEAMERSFDYYVDFWREAGESAFVPWQAAAWSNVYFLTEERKYADFVFELIDWSVGRQNRSSYGDWAKDDYAGAYTKYTGSPPNFSTATHSEPIPLAIAVARDVGDDARVARYVDAQKHAMRFVLQLLITERETIYMPSPERSLGGIRTRLDDSNVRIDNVQHAATAFIHALQYLDDGDLAAP